MQITGREGTRLRTRIRRRRAASSHWRQRTGSATSTAAYGLRRSRLKATKAHRISETDGLQSSTTTLNNLHDSSVGNGTLTGKGNGRGPR